jgi:hypothetical protein
MRSLGMTIVQKLCKGIGDDRIINGSREQLLLRVAREFRPNLQRCAPEQGGKLVLIHGNYLGRLSSTSAEVAALKNLGSNRF